MRAEYRGEQTPVLYLTPAGRIMVITHWSLGPSATIEIEMEHDVTDHAATRLVIAESVDRHLAGPPVVVKTQEEKIAFRKEWDRRVDEGRQAGAPPALIQPTGAVSSSTVQASAARPAAAKLS